MEKLLGSPGWAFGQSYEPNVKVFTYKVSTMKWGW